jgi:hypothetical protein
MIRKGQVWWVKGNDVRCQIRFIGSCSGWPPKNQTWAQR